MKETLESNKMTGFIDGSLRDPDPKGESQDENVRLYSVKWEKFDTQVMEWTRDSIDDTLKEVVKESKTSKAIWGMLWTHFGKNFKSYPQYRYMKGSRHCIWILI